MAQGIAVLGMVMLHLFCRLGNLPYTPWIWVGATPLVYYLGLFKDLVLFAKYPILVLALMLVVCFAASMVIECLNQPVLTHIERKKRKEARR